MKTSWLVAALSLLLLGSEMVHATNEKGFKLTCPTSRANTESSRMINPRCTVSEPAETLPPTKRIHPDATGAWISIGSNAQIAVYIDEASAMRSGDTVSAWIKTVHKTPAVSPRSGSAYVVDLATGTYSCTTEGFYTGMRWLYNADGYAFDLLPPSAPDLHLTANSPLAVKFHALCAEG